MSPNPCPDGHAALNWPVVALARCADVGEDAAVGLAVCPAGVTSQPTRSELARRHVDKRARDRRIIVSPFAFLDICLAEGEQMAFTRLLLALSMRCQSSGDAGKDALMGISFSS